MAYNPNVPAPTNRVQDDIAAMRDNFQHLAPLAQAVGELQTVSGLAPVVEELQVVSELAPYVQALLDSRIVEMGSNSNGTYVRWENGVQVCWHDMNIRSPNDWGASYTSGEWTLPAEFGDNAYARFATAGQSEGGADPVTGRLNAGMSRHASSTPSSCRWSVRSNGADNSTAASVFLLAIGRWK